MNNTSSNSKSNSWLSTLYHALIVHGLKRRETAVNAIPIYSAAPIWGSIANLAIFDYYDALNQGGEMKNNTPVTKDTLGKWFDESEATDYQSFQKGVSKSAVSMRERAMACVFAPGLGMKPDDIINHIKNAIGQLPDIPE